MPGQKRSPKKPQMSSGVIVAIISFAGVVITAFCTSSSAIGGKIIEALTNPDRAVLSQKSQASEPTLTATITPVSPSPIPTVTMLSISIPAAESTAECGGAEIYFKLNLSTGVDQIKCPNQHNVIDLESGEIQGLSVLSGKAIAPAFTSDTICSWKWSTNENISTQEFSSPKGDCIFSIALTKTAKKYIYNLSPIQINLSFRSTFKDKLVHA